MSKRKTRRMILGIMLLSVLIVGLGGCKSKKTSTPKSEEDFLDNVTSKKDVMVDGEEMTEYTLQDGGKVAVPKENDGDTQGKEESE